MSRIPFPTVETMNEAQRAVYDDIVSGPRGRLVGPLRAVLHNPELAQRWQKLGEMLRFGTSLPPRLNELAILVTARYWNSQIEWYIHEQAALSAGLPQAIADEIKNCEPPGFTEPQDAAVYEFARQLLAHGTVAPAVYERIRTWFDVTGVVELTAVVGYYTMVSMTLNAHEIPLPDGAPAPLVPAQRDGVQALSTLAPICLEDIAA
ncbi:MAG: carboxymuconolactone decarboxylase family protein [Advenella sp.]